MDHAIAAAFAAGREILEVYGSPIAVDLKQDRSPITEADRRAHQVIHHHLTGTGIPVLSEEGREIIMEERQAWERYWLVDPLDGTKEFIQRNGEFTVNIALMHPLVPVPGAGSAALGTHTPLAGALYAPVPDILYFAWNGAGAYKLGQAATRGTTSALKLAALAQRLPLPMHRTAFTIVASRNHGTPDTEAYISRMQRIHGEVALTTVGSALKIGLLAEGTADAYPRYAPTMEWDTAAGQIIAKEAGKQLIDVTTDEPMRYNKRSLVNNWFIVH